MLLDACALMEAPSRGRRSDTVGKEAVSDAREEVLQILSITSCGYDEVLVGGIRNERIDAAVGINEAGDDSEPELLFRETLEYLVYRRERVSSGRALGENQDVGLAAIRLREVRKCAARLAPGRAGRDIRSPGGKRLQMRVPSGFRQEDFHAQDALQCALDFHVEAGQDRNPTPVIPVLIRIPGIPAAAQRICVRVSRAQVRLWRHGSLRGRDAGRCEAREDDRRESGNHPWPRAPANAGTKMPHVSKMRRVIIPASLGISLRKTDC